MKKNFTTLLLLLILSINSYAQEKKQPELKKENKPKLEKMIHLGIIQKFSGTITTTENNIIQPKSTTMLELTVSLNRRGFLYSAFRVSTPLTYMQPNTFYDIGSRYLTDTQVGFGLGGGYRFGRIDPETGKGSLLSLGISTVMDFSVYNKQYFLESVQFNNGTITIGTEFMTRYEYSANGKTTFVLGFDFGLMSTSYGGFKQHSTIIDNSFYYSYERYKIYSFTYGGVIGIRF